MNRAKHLIFPDSEKVLQRCIQAGSAIMLTDRKLGTRRVIPKEIVNDMIGGKKLYCWVQTVEHLGDNGNRMDIVPLHDITNIQDV